MLETTSVFTGLAEKERSEQDLPFLLPQIFRGAVRTDAVDGQVELLHLADGALAKGVAEDDRALVLQHVRADQNFGQRACDRDVLGQRLGDLTAELLVS